MTETIFSFNLFCLENFELYVNLNISSTYEGVYFIGILVQQFNLMKTMSLNAEIGSCKINRVNNFSTQVIGCF